MFLESGHDAEMLQIREALNTAQELTEFGAASLAHSLIILLESLADPILPDVVSQQLSFTPVTTVQMEQRVLSMLPTLNYNVYIYIMSFLRVLLAETSSDMLTAEALAFVFANAFTKRCQSPMSPTDLTVNHGVVEFLKRFMPH